VHQNSSRELKEEISDVSEAEALEALEFLVPVKYRFRGDVERTAHLGFIAEDMPELVASRDKKTVCQMEIVAVLTKILQIQQLTTARLLERIRRLDANLAATHL
jgi:hypothetical protein